MIIIPDIHGRSFWKEAVAQRKEDERIVFLGDYLDPYPGEVDPYTNKVITQQSALENFKEIISFANNTTNVFCLLGNHDVEYLFSSCTPCRQDVMNKDIISDLFNKNKHLFSLYYLERIDGTDFLFTHAGITPLFLIQMEIYENNLEGKNARDLYETRMFKDEDFIDYIDLLEQRWQDDSHRLGPILGWIGASRGGRGYGSPVWADWSELSSSLDDYFEGETNLFQIVGHSQHNVMYPWESGPVLRVEDKCACLDCRAAFRLTKIDEKVDFIPITKVENARYED